MVVRAEDDREYWSIPLRASQPHVYNQAAAVFTSGLQMVVVHRGVLHALSAPDRRHLWTQPLPDRGLNAHNRPIVDEPVEALQPASGFAARVGLSRFRSPAGMLAAVTPWCVAHHGRGEIVALDPVSGDVLWRRRGIAPQTMVHGDQDVLYVAPQEAGDAIAVRAGDGRRLEREGLSGLVKAGLAVIDGAVVAAERNAVRTALGARSGTFRLRAVEPATSTQRWSQEFPDQIRLSLIGREELFVLAPDCACEVLDLARGTRTPLGRLPEELAKATQIHAVADAEHVYLTIDHPRNNAFSYVSSPAIRVNGTIVAFSRERGGLAWQQKVENQNLLLSQFAHSPLLVCTAFQSEQRRNVHVQTVRLVAIDKRTGRIVAEMNRPSAGGGFQQFALSRSERFIELRSYNERVRIQATEPHAGGGGE
jgi:outer membrane protein assembly factor BamB